MLNNIELYRTSRMEILKDRVDIAGIIARISLPIGRSKLIDQCEISRASATVQDKCGASFSFLANLGCDAMVFEGAGPFLPAWKGAPVPSHLFLITSEFISFFPNTDFSPNIIEDSKEGYHIDDLLRYLGMSPRSKYVEPFYIAESESRESTAEQIVKTLLERP